MYNTKNVKITQNILSELATFSLHLIRPRRRHLIYIIRIVFNTPRHKSISTNLAISLPAYSMRVNPLIHHKWTTDLPIHPHARTLGMKR